VAKLSSQYKQDDAATPHANNSNAPYHKIKAEIFYCMPIIFITFIMPQSATGNILLNVVIRILLIPVVGQVKVKVK
jgi:uncharacterized protein YqhQ